MAAKTTPRDQPLALGYIRVSTHEQADKGASLDEQRAALVSECVRCGWNLRVLADEAASAKTLNRPALQKALADSMPGMRTTC